MRSFSIGERRLDPADPALDTRSWLDTPDRATQQRPPRAASERNVRITARFDIHPHDLFAAWLDATHAGSWLFATANHPMTEVTIDPRIGGDFRFAERHDGGVAEHCGTY